MSSRLLNQFRKVPSQEPKWDAVAERFWSCRDEPIVCLNPILLVVLVVGKNHCNSGDMVQSFRIQIGSHGHPQITVEVVAGPRCICKRLIFEDECGQM